MSLTIDEETAERRQADAEILDLLRSVQTVGRTQEPIAGTPLGTRTYYLADPVVRESRLRGLRVFNVGAAGVIRVLLGTRVGIAITKTSDTEVTIQPGLNLLTRDQLPEIVAAAGQFVGVRGAGLVSVTGAATDDHPGYYDNVGDVNVVTDATPNQANRIEISFEWESVTLSEARVASVEDRVRSGFPHGCLGLADPLPKADVYQVIGYGQSNDIARGASVLNASPSVRHLTFNVGVRMTKPGLTGGGLPDDGAKKALVEATSNSDGGGNCGQTKHWTASFEATRRAARFGSAPTFFRSSAGKGGSGMSVIGYGTAWYANLRFHSQQARTLVAADGKTHAVLAVEFDHGETDQLNNVPLATYRADVSALIDGHQADLATDGGQTERVQWLFTTSPYQIKVGAGPSLAVMELCALPSEGGRADCHLVLPGYRLIDENADNTHLTAVSQALKGHYYGRAEAQLLSGRVPDRVWWQTVVAQGQTLTAWLLAPTPVVINTALCGAATDQGIKVVDDTGTLTLSGIGVGTAIPAEGVPGWWRTPLTVTLNRALGANPVFRYGLDYANALLNATGGAGGCLFDTTSDTCVISGSSHPMVHPAPVCSKPVSVID